MRKKKEPNENIKQYQALIKSELDAFALHNNTAAGDFTFNERFAAYESVMPLGNITLHFFADEAIMMGYRFIEGDDIEMLPCLITRLQFPFSDYYFSLYDIHNALGLSDFKTLDFHYLTDENMQRYAVSAVFNFITVNRAGIDAIGRDAHLQQALIQCYEHDLKLVSKRIKKEKLEKDLMKYTYSHEVDMYFHNDLADVFTAFINKGKVKELNKRLEKLDKKAKLLTFEKRYFEFLKLRGFEVPQGYLFSANREMHKTHKATTRVNVVIEIISFIMMMVIGVIVSGIAEEITADGRQVISSSEILNSFWLYVFASLGLSFILQMTVGRAVCRKLGAKNIFESNKPLSNVIIAALCVAVICGYGFTEWGNGKNIAALGDNGIYIGAAYHDGVELPYDSERLTFALCEGVLNYDMQPEYQNSIDDKTLYILVDGDYESFCCTDNYECDLEQLLAELEDKGADIDRLYDQQAFEKKYNPNYDPSDWEPYSDNN